MGAQLDAVLKGNITLHFHSFTPAALALDSDRLFVQPAEMLFHAALTKFFIIISQRNFLFPHNSRHSSPGSIFFSDQSSKALQGWPFRAAPAPGAGCSPRRGTSCCSTHEVPGSCLSPCPLCSLAAQPGPVGCFANVSGLGPWRGKGLYYTLFS